MNSEEWSKMKELGLGQMGGNLLATTIVTLKVILIQPRQLGLENTFSPHSLGRIMRAALDFFGKKRQQLVNVALCCV
jgi:hypothetical protein